MRLVDYLLAPLALLGLIAVSWWGVYQSPASAVNLQARLERDAMVALRSAGIDWADVSMEGQRAVLTGQAPSSDAVDQAAAVVLNATGQGGLLWGGVTQIENAATAAAPVETFSWHALKTDSGLIRLSGHVPSRAIRTALLAEAGRQAGDAGVEDHMELASGAPGGNWQGIARLGLSALGQLDAGQARLAGNILRVTGNSGDDAIREAVMTEIAAVAAPYRGEAVVHGEATWSARRDADRLILEGRVPDAATKAVLYRAARQEFSGEVADEMVVDPTVPAGRWIDGARAGLPYFAAFTTGEMHFDPAVTGLSFEGEAPASTLYFLRRALTPYKPTLRTFVVADALTQFAGEADDCEEAVNEALATGDIAFQAGTSVLLEESGPALDTLAGAVLSCERTLSFEVWALPDTQGAGGAEAQAYARARSLGDFLYQAGLDASRLTAIGSGTLGGDGSMDEATGRAKNRRVGLKVRERSN